MTINAEVETLKNVPLFRTIEPAKLRLLAFVSERITFKPGEVICQQGEIGDSAYIILSGRADIMVSQDEAPPRKVAEMGENDVVGEISILCDTPRTASVVAASEVVALTIAKESFLKILREFPDVALEIMRVLARRLERTTRDVVALRGRLSAGEGI